MKITSVKRHKLLAPSGCVVCGAKPLYMGVFVPKDSTRIYGYEICGECRNLSEKDPSLLLPVEEAILASDVQGVDNENHA